MKTRLWDKGDAIDDMVLEFTVGNDPQLDLSLVKHDCIGSAAHARMLGSIGLLSREHVRALLTELHSIQVESAEGRFVISQEQEDCHTAIEGRLTSKLGDIGGRIHTGRSRNDQILLATRLFMRAQLLDRLEQIDAVGVALVQRFESDHNLPLPGYTHLMPAMPASVGMWLHAFFEMMLHALVNGLHLLDRMNSNPLGAGSGFDTPLPLDKRLVAQLLGMSRVDRSAIAAQNSRGQRERELLFWLTEIGASLEKFAWDLQLFFMREFGFLTLPPALTTGSSIMPQKRNPDVLELLRARASKLRGCLSEVTWVSGKLPSHYHRDLQLTKEPMIRGCHTAYEMLAITPRVLTGMTWNDSRLASMMHDELYVTYDAFRRVQAGAPFREAYRATAAAFADGTLEIAPLKDDFRIISARVKEAMSEAESEFESYRATLREYRTRIDQAEASVFSVDA